MSEFKRELNRSIRRSIKERYGLDTDPVVEHPAQESHGDYSTNAAMVLAKDLRKSPLEVAKEVSETVSSYQLPAVKEVEAVKPGFVNFWLTGKALAEEVNEANRSKERYGSSESGTGKTVVIDYSAPNIAKRFGVGHLRSTVIGQALYNLYKFSGYEVIGDNHLGDWGTQFGALLRQIKSSRFKVQNLSVGDLEKLYVDFHRKAAENPKLKEEAREWFLKLENGDPEARRIWRAVVDISRKEFDRIYRFLGVEFDRSYGESFYEDKMPAVIEEVRERGLSKESEGAEIIEFPSLPPAILVKSDGATTYFTRDLATVKFRIQEWDPRAIVYEVGADQKLHFQQVFEAAKKLGWADGRKMVHVAHGLIRFERGKMSTRRGQAVKLEDVLEEAVVRAEKLTGQKGSVAEAVGIGAVKYFDLSHQPQTDIIFDWEKMFLLEGNSAPYLQYTYARAISVLRKSKTENPPLIVDPSAGDEELPLLRYIYRFPEAMEEALNAHSPNLLCNYLFDLAQRFNRFYAAAPIIKAEENRELRLALTGAAAQVLKNGLALLGIEAPERL